MNGNCFIRSEFAVHIKEHIAGSGGHFDFFVASVSRRNPVLSEIVSGGYHINSLARLFKAAKLCDHFFVRLKIAVACKIAADKHYIASLIRRYLSKRSIKHLAALGKQYLAF